MFWFLIERFLYIITFMIEIVNLSKKDKKNRLILNNLNFNIHENELHVFLGKNGAGKTVTLGIICGLDSEFSGKILKDNVDIYKSNKTNNYLFVPTDIRFPNHLKVIDLIKFYVNEIFELETNELFINETLKEFHLDERKDYLPKKLSSGEKRKLMLLISKLVKPKYLFLDEPEANLDPYSRNELFKLLNMLKKEGTSIFTSSHLISEELQDIDRITILHNKTIVLSKKVKSAKNLKIIFDNFKRGGYD